MGELSKVEIERFIWNNWDFIQMFEIVSGNKVRVRTEEGLRWI